MSHSIRVATGNPALAQGQRSRVPQARGPVHLLALCLVMGAFTWASLDLYRLSELDRQQATVIDSHWRYQAQARRVAELAQKISATSLWTEGAEHRHLHAALAQQYAEVVQTHQHLLSATPVERTSQRPFGPPYLRAYRLHGAELERSFLALESAVEQLLKGAHQRGGIDAVPAAHAVSNTVLGTLLPMTQDVLSHYLLEIEGRRSAAQRTIRQMLALALLGVLGAAAYVYRPMARALSASREELRRARTALLHDELTGLANRRYLREFASVALANTKRTQRAGALLRLDIDHFKRINDTLGHASGDAALREVANVLRKEVRQGDLAVRMGGDEFVVLACELGDGEDYRKLADRLLARFRRPITIGTQEITVSISIGVSLTPMHSCELEELLAQSDVALYESKRRGRNQWQLFEPSRSSTGGRRAGV